MQEGRTWTRWGLAAVAGAGLLSGILASGRSALQDTQAVKAPRLYRVIVPVSDLDEAVEFYGELLGIAGQRVSGGRHYYDCGGTILALLDPKGDQDDETARPLPDHLYFAVADLEQIFARAKRLGGLSRQTGDGDLPQGEIARRPWGERSFSMTDPFGSPLCFVDETTLFTGR